MDISLRIMEFAAALDAYLKGKEHGYFQKVDVITGKKFAKIAVMRGGQRSVYCFIDLSNGDILKSAGWKAPAKGKRGSILNEGYDIGDGKPCDEFGSGMYMRG